MCAMKQEFTVGEPRTNSHQFPGSLRFAPRLVRGEVQELPSVGLRTVLCIALTTYRASVFVGSGLTTLHGKFPSHGQDRGQKPWYQPACVTEGGRRPTPKSL